MLSRIPLTHGYRAQGCREYSLRANQTAIFLTCVSLVVCVSGKGGPPDTTFIEDAVLELLKTRRILKCSYPYGFFLEPKSTKKEIYELMQVRGVLLLFFFKEGQIFWRLWDVGEAGLKLFYLHNSPICSVFTSQLLVRFSCCIIHDCKCGQGMYLPDFFFVLWPLESGKINERGFHSTPNPPPLRSGLL